VPGGTQLDSSVEYPMAFIAGDIAAIWLGRHVITRTAGYRLDFEVMKRATARIRHTRCKYAIVIATHIVLQQMTPRRLA
jgi:hypothetical protein